MSITAPPTRPSTATTANGTRNQIGSVIAIAPTGSVAIAAASPGDEPASSRPTTSSTSSANDEPKVVQPTTLRADAERGRYREESPATLTQPRPNPVRKNTSAPMTWAGEPAGSAATVDQSICGSTRTM